MKGVSLFGGTGFIGTHYLKGYDFDNVHLIERYSRRPKPDTDILYLTSTTNNYNVFDDATLDVQTNLVVFTETLDSWRKNNPEGIFNFVSSWFVYGDTILPANEDYSVCNPKGFYSITKRCAEQLLISYAETFGLKYRILRLGNVVGPGDKGVSAKKNALQYLIDKMSRDEDIDVYEGGDFTRNYIHVQDCVAAIDLVMDAGKTNEIYNIAYDRCYRFMDILEYVAGRLSYAGEFNYIEQKDFHKKVQVKSFNMTTDKLYNLGFKPFYPSMHSWVDSLL